MLPTDERPRYQSDLGVSWLRLPILVAGPLLTAVVLAFTLKIVYILGWYLALLLALGFGFLLGGLLLVLVDWTRCRNCWLAGSMGVMAGLVAYLGYYHLCLVDLLPPGNAWRVDLLPKYVGLRLRNDVIENLGIGNDFSRVNPQGKRPTPFSNYWFFIGELLIITGVPSAFAWKRASRAYCVELGQWMRKEKALLPPYADADFRTALEEGTLPQFIAKNPAGHAPLTASRLILEYAAPKIGSPLRFPVYFSLEDFPMPRPWYLPGTARLTLVRQIELELAEVMALRPLFPKLTRLLQTHRAELRDPPPEVSVAPGSSHAVRDRAKIIPVPGPFRQRVLGKRYNLWVNLFGISPSAYLRRLRRTIAQRPELLVDPQYPAAIFVSLIPRENFSAKGFKWMWASDLLFLKLDRRSRQLLMEGDMDRYRIPSGAIAVCEPQCFFNPYDRLQKNPVWMVRLMVCVERGWQELLLSINPERRGLMTIEGRHPRTEDMCRRIAEL